MLVPICLVPVDVALQIGLLGNLDREKSFGVHVRFGKLSRKHFIIKLIMFNLYKWEKQVEGVVSAEIKSKQQEERKERHSRKTDSLM
jgi:hypothetical protein